MVGAGGGCLKRVGTGGVAYLGRTGFLVASAFACGVEFAFPLGLPLKDIARARELRPKRRHPFCSRRRLSACHPVPLVDICCTVFPMAGQLVRSRAENRRKSLSISPLFCENAPDKHGGANSRRRIVGCRLGLASFWAPSRRIASAPLISPRAVPCCECPDGQVC